MADPTPESLRAEARELLPLLHSRWNELPTQMKDAVTQALLLVLGSGPSVAALDSLLSGQKANGLMYHNAVANQQKTNLLGMAMTAKCVRYMLDPDTHAIDEMSADDIHTEG